MTSNTFAVSIECDNDAFKDLDHGRDEVARLLTKVAQQVRDGDMEGLIFDINGNRVGRFFTRYHNDDAHAAGATAMSEETCG